MLTGRPRKLRSGDWGALLPLGSEIQEGEQIRVETRTGKEWYGVVTHIIDDDAFGVLVEYRSLRDDESPGQMTFDTPAPKKPKTSERLPHARKIKVAGIKRAAMIAAERDVSALDIRANWPGRRIAVHTKKGNVRVRKIERIVKVRGEREIDVIIEYTKSR